MQIYKHHIGLPKKHRHGSIAIGNFDGMHKGHCEVIRQAGLFARERTIPWGVLTFEPHPREFFNKVAPLFRLTPPNIKNRQIEALGVEFLVVIRFDNEFAKITADEFISQILVQSLNASYIVSGFNFAFGHKRSGNTEFLQTKGKQLGFGTADIKEVLDEGGKIISSTRIRKYLIEGNPKAAANLLGRYFEIEGVASRGDQRGHKIGFPTANILLNNNLRPAIGVYAIKAAIGPGLNTIWHDGVANLGYRPTFNGSDCILETHLFNFDQDIYDANLKIKLIEFIRPEKNFENVEKLTEQIKLDCSRSKSILSCLKTKEFI